MYINCFSVSTNKTSSTRTERIWITPYSISICNTYQIAPFQPIILNPSYYLIWLLLSSNWSASAKPCPSPTHDVSSTHLDQVESKRHKSSSWPSLSSQTNQNKPTIKRFMAGEIRVRLMSGCSLHSMWHYSVSGEGFHFRNYGLICCLAARWVDNGIKLLRKNGSDDNSGPLL